MSVHIGSSNAAFLRVGIPTPTKASNTEGTAEGSKTPLGRSPMMKGRAPQETALDVSAMRGTAHHTNTQRSQLNNSTVQFSSLNDILQEATEDGGNATVSSSSIKQTPANRPNTANGSPHRNKIKPRNPKGRKSSQQLANVSRQHMTLPTDTVYQPPSQVTALRLVRAQREAQRQARLLQEKHVPAAVTPDSFLDRFVGRTPTTSMAKPRKKVHHPDLSSFLQNDESDVEEEDTEDSASAPTAATASMSRSHQHQKQPQMSVEEKETVRYQTGDTRPHLKDGVKSYSGIFGGSSTLLDKAEYDSGDRCRSLFVSWCEQVLREGEATQYQSVWVESLLHQLKQQTAALPPTNTYRALSVLTLLLKALDSLVPLVGRKLVFTLMDEFLHVVLEGWDDVAPTADVNPKQSSAANPASGDANRERPSSTPHLSRNEQHTSSPNKTTLSSSVVFLSKTMKDIQSATICGDNTCSDMLQSDYQTSTRCGKVLHPGVDTTAATRIAEVFTATRLFSETAIESRAAEETQALKTVKQLHAQAVEERKKREMVLREAHESKKTFVRYAFNAWHGLTITSRQKRATSHGVINQMNRQHNRTLIKTVFLVFKHNRMFNIQRRVQATHDANVREYRVKEATSLERISKLQAQLATQKADHIKATEDAEEHFWREKHKIIEDTREMRETTGDKVKMIDQLTNERNSGKELCDRWMKLCHKMYHDMCGVFRPSAEGYSSPSTVKVVELLKRGEESTNDGEQTVSNKAKTMSKRPGAPEPAVVEEPSNDDLATVATYFSRQDPEEELLYRRTVDEDGEYSRMPLSSFKTLTDVFETPSAVQKTLLFFCNAALRREQPDHELVQNFGRDFSDSAVYISLLLIMYPESVSRDMFDIPTDSLRAEAVCAAFESLGLHSMISPTDIVLSVVLRNVAMVTVLFRIYATPLRLKLIQTQTNSSSDGFDLVSEASLRSLSRNSNGGVPVVTTSHRAGVGVNVSITAAPPHDGTHPASIATPGSTTSTPRIKDLFAPLRHIDTMEQAVSRTLQANKSWALLSELSLRDTIKSLQNVRSTHGEVLDERRRRFMDWFLLIHEKKLAPLVLLSPQNARNEIDRVDGVLRGQYWELHAIYQAYATAGGSLLMSQPQLLKLCKDSGITKGLGRGALDEAYRFATLNTESNSSCIFAPTAVGATKRALTPAMTNMQVTPSIFLHTLIHLASQRCIKRLELQSQPASPTGSTNTKDANEPAVLHLMLRNLIVDEILNNAATSSFEEFRSTARHPLVQRQFKPLARYLTRSFKMYASINTKKDQPQASPSKQSPSVRSPSVAAIGSSTGGSSTDNHMMQSDDFYRMLRDLRLIDGKVAADDITSLFSYLCGCDDDKLQEAAEAQRLVVGASAGVASPSPANTSLTIHTGDGENSTTSKTDGASATAPSSVQQPSSPNGPTTEEKPPTYASTISYKEFLDGLAAVASMRHPHPHFPLHMRLQAMLRDPFTARLKELAK